MEKKGAFLITDLVADSKEIAIPNDYLSNLKKAQELALALMREELPVTEMGANLESTTPSQQPEQSAYPNPNEPLPVTEMGAKLEAIPNQQPEQPAYPNPNEPLPVVAERPVSNSGNIFDTPEYQDQQPKEFSVQPEQINQETTPVVDIPTNLEPKPPIIDASQIGVEKDQASEVILTEEDLYLMHMIKEGDDIYKVSLELGVSPEDLTKRNGLSPTDILVPGKMLFVPIKKDKLSKAELKFFQTLLPKMQNIFVENTKKDEYQSLNDIGEMTI